MRTIAKHYAANQKVSTIKYSVPRLWLYDCYDCYNKAVPGGTALWGR